jgi:hypothetical protein
VIDQSTFDLQKFTDLAVSVSAILFGKPDHSQTLIIIIMLSCFVSKSAAGNPKNLACPSLEDAELLTRLNDCTA